MEYIWGGMVMERKGKDRKKECVYSCAQVQVKYI